MEKTEIQNTSGPSRYLLREAGGSLWLVDTRQTGVPYIPPVQMNETGARIWTLRESGRSTREIAELIGGEEGIPSEQILPDVEGFLKEIENRLLLERKAF